MQAVVGSSEPAMTQRVDGGAARAAGMLFERPAAARGTDDEMEHWIREVSRVEHGALGSSGNPSLRRRVEGGARSCRRVWSNGSSAEFSWSEPVLLNQGLCRGPFRKE
jgi:hypothetical protein